MFFKKKKDSESYAAVTLLDLHYKGTIDDKKFLRMFGKQNVFYTTPFGDHNDGSSRLFLIPGPDGTGYFPVFSSLERMKEHYELAGRKNYIVMKGTFLDVLKTTRSTNKGDAPVKMGVIIDPRYYDVTVDAIRMDMVIGIVDGSGFY